MFSFLFNPKMRWYPAWSQSVYQSGNLGNHFKEIFFIRSLPCNKYMEGQRYVLPRLPLISVGDTTMHSEYSPNRSAPVIPNSHNMKSTSPSITYINFPTNLTSRKVDWTVTFEGEDSSGAPEASSGWSGHGWGNCFQRLWFPAWDPWERYLYIYMVRLGWTGCHDISCGR